ncbi:MAG TPA: cupin domain-containing protein, partial [Bryobacteraceae bacterium]|nr:cupin domain-containing protein [Bryobacteraceae bacterium]
GERMTTLTTAPPEALLIPAGATANGHPLDIYGSWILPKLTGAQTGGNLAILESITPPGGGPPYHVHHREEEGFYVLEGEFLFEIGDRRIHAKPGDFLLAPRDIPHCFQNVGQTTGRKLVIVQPSGLELFFADIAAVAGPPDPAKMVPIFHQYGLELLGPPMALRQS